MPTVSVIIPNYNHAKFLRQRIDSVLAQTSQDLEIILLDDCSTDDSTSVLEEYSKNPKVSHYVANTKNSGSPFSQWKKGIELASGEFIWIAESDDYADPDLLSALTPVLRKNPELVVSYCRSEMVDEHGVAPNPGNFYCDSLDKERWHSSYTNTGKDEIINYARYMNTIPNASSTIIRRSAAVTLDFPVTMRFTGDWYFWLQLLNQGGVAYECQPLNFFRCHSNTTRSTTDLASERQRFQEIGHCLQYAQERIDSPSNICAEKLRWLHSKSRKHLGWRRITLMLNKQYPLDARFALACLAFKVPVSHILSRTPLLWRLNRLTQRLPVKRG